MRAGWSTSTFSKTLSQLAKKEGVQFTVRTGTQTPLSCRVSVGPPSVDADSNGRETRAGIAMTGPANSRARSKEVKAPVGWHKAGVGMTPVAPAPGDGGGSGKNKSGGAAKPSKGADKQGCGLRQMAGPTSVTEQARDSSDNAQLTARVGVGFSTRCRTWGKRVQIFVQEFRPPVPPPISCGIV